jgi:hypothetical protein
MKKITSVLLIALFVIIGLPACASPSPAAPLRLTWTVSPDTAAGLVAFQTVYQWRAQDSDWVVLATVETIATEVVLGAPAQGTRYVVTCTGTNGIESGYSMIVTNQIGTIAAPGVLRITR